MLGRFGGLVVSVSLVGCGPAGHSTPGGAGVDAAGTGSGDSGGGNGGGGGSGDTTSYLVYAHSDTILYTIDLATQNLVTIGDFNAPPPSGGNSPDVITDLAVAPSGTIYVISNTSLYTADPTDAHVTRVGSLANCGQKGVALTTTSDGRLWMGDFMGSICEIDISQTPPVVRAPVTMSGGMALAGDMVGIGDGTVFGTAYQLNQSSTQNDNLLVTIDVATGAVATVGPSGYPKLFGASFQENKVFAFTHDGTGRVVTIDPTTGVGTMFGTFMDPSTSHGISFAGAGVNSLIVIE
jgi:hypothetical protein